MDLVLHSIYLSMSTAPWVIFLSVCLSIILFIAFVDKCIDHYAKKDRNDFVEDSEVPIITPYKLDA